MFLFPVEVKECEYGLGVFSKVYIPEWVMVFKMTPWSLIKFDPEYVKVLPAPIQEMLKKYAYQKNGTVNFCPLDDRFLNHSDVPNIRQIGDDDWSTREIHPGEQIFCNYRELDDGGWCSGFLNEA